MTTPLDALCATPFHEADAPARAAILRRLADTMLFAAAAAEGSAELRRFALEGGGAAVLACDDEARLAEAMGGPADFVALPGRALAALAAGQGCALLVNPGAPSAMLLTSEALAWLVAALAPAPEAAPAEPPLLAAPDAAMTAALSGPLAARLPDLPATALHLVAAGQGHLLLVEGAPRAAEGAIAKAIAELVAFLPPLPSALDVAFAPLPLPEGALTLRRAAPAPAPRPPRPSGPPILR